ncbi:MAG: hypothetical protein CK519_03620 [Opitutia bacterium]|nr:MAG: hypothetical protein CK519_03620 [Opitutae bacterium]
MGRGKDTKRKADQIAGIRNVAEGHEGASWHVGTLARGEARYTDGTQCRPYQLIQGTCGQGDTVTWGSEGRDAVAPLPTKSGDTWARGEAKY